MKRDYYWDAISIPCHQLQRWSYYYYYYFSFRWIFFFFFFTIIVFESKNENKMCQSTEINCTMKMISKNMLKAHSRGIPKSPKTEKLVQLHLKLPSNRSNSKFIAILMCKVSVCVGTVHICFMKRNRDATLSLSTKVALIYGARRTLKHR